MYKYKDSQSSQGLGIQGDKTEQGKVWQFVMGTYIWLYDINTDMETLLVIYDFYMYVYIKIVALLLENINCHNTMCTWIIYFICIYVLNMYQMGQMGSLYISNWPHVDQNIFC